MANFDRRVRAWMLAVIAAFALLGVAETASAASYLGADLSDVKPEDKVTIEHPQPVQVLFQFETRGAPNARGTKLVKQQVLDTVKASGLFSDVSEAPTANGAILSIVIDDLADSQDMGDAKAKGFVTGATFFVAGSTVRDKYQCNVDYVGGPNASKISRVARHALYFQMGLINSPPANAVKIGSLKDALNTMIRQIVSNPLNDLGRDPGFQLAAPPSTVPAPTAAGDTTPATAPAPAEPATATSPTTAPPLTAPPTQPVAAQ